jgi:hypothetical protein
MPLDQTILYFTHVGKNQTEDTLGRDIPMILGGRKRALERNKGFVRAWGTGPTMWLQRRQNMGKASEPEVTFLRFLL